MRAFARAYLYLDTQQLVAFIPFQREKPLGDRAARECDKNTSSQLAGTCPCQGTRTLLHYAIIISLCRSPFTDHGSIETPDHSTSSMDRPSPGTNEGGAKG